MEEKHLRAKNPQKAKPLNVKMVKHDLFFGDQHDENKQPLKPRTSRKKKDTKGSPTAATPDPDAPGAGNYDAQGERGSRFSVI